MAGRSSSQTQPAGGSRIAKIGETELNCDTLAVHCNNTDTEIPAKGFYLLFKLVVSPPTAFLHTDS